MIILFLKLNQIKTKYLLCHFSRAIMCYLAEKFRRDDKLYPEKPQERAIVNHRLYFDLGTLYQRFADLYVSFIDYTFFNIYISTFIYLMLCLCHKHPPQHKSYLNKLKLLMTMVKIHFFVDSFCLGISSKSLDPMLRKLYFVFFYDKNHQIFNNNF